MPISSKNEALDLLEAARREYVAAARATAVKLFLETGAPVTVDDIRLRCPPPEDVDPRVMGCLLRAPSWAKVDYVNSSRRTCHNRPISSFVWTGL